MEEIRISVRNLVEFLLRSGDIDSGGGKAPDKEAMQLGSKLHRKIQSKMGGDYRAEVSLSVTIPCEDYQLVIEGRADGIQENEKGVLVDEIKGTYKDLEYLEEPYDIHLAQAKCYGSIYGAQNHLESVSIQMTYINMETEEIKRFVREYKCEELHRWFTNLVEEYKRWCRCQLDWKKVRQASIKEINFPYDYREGQKDLAGGVYRTIYHKKKLFIQAPTGVGKTMSVVFPAIKAVGEGLGDKLFYLTAKTITRTVAAQAFSVLKEGGLRYKVVTLTAEEKICPQEEMVCSPQSCPYARGHYDRINKAVFQMICEQEDFSRETLLAQAKKHKVCPFELSLDVSLWVDGVICDYNYVFEPRARLKRYFAEGSKGDYLFLIDEAHNLVERGREMFSAVLVKEEFLEVKRLVKTYNRKLSAALERCNKRMLEWKRECEAYEIIPDLGTFPLSLMNLSGELEKFLEDYGDFAERDQILNLYFSVGAFLDTVDCLDENYVIYTENRMDGRFMIKLFCIDTGENIQKCLDRGNSTVFFSATLLPMSYYHSLLSRSKEDYAIYAKSPFDSSRRGLFIARDVSSRYTSRGQSTYERIADYISHGVKARAGNYLVFFPSYKMMDEVAECFEKRKQEDILLLKQYTGMQEEERESFLEAFSRDSKESVVGFCVMGGIFGEGIDLQRDKLIGAIIVGTGLPQICNEREILKEYYRKKGLDGFAYAYQYPGMNKVLQAAGRVIRTQEDKGIVMLLDDRFLKGSYQEMFPLEWETYESCTVNTIEDKLRSFWEKA